MRGKEGMEILLGSIAQRERLSPAMHGDRLRVAGPA